MKAARVRDCVLATALCVAAHAAEAPRDPGAVVESFYASLASGATEAAAALLAEDAIVLENGRLESRAEYVAHHLTADIAFARAVPQSRSDVRVVALGDAAWVSARTRAEGAFRGRAVRSEGAELIVLARGAAGWRIRAIHWSSHDSEPEVPSELRKP
jgi:ketosteroid isomerase-like protein